MFVLSGFAVMVRINVARVQPQEVDVLDPLRARRKSVTSGKAKKARVTGSVPRDDDLYKFANGIVL